MKRFLLVLISAILIAFISINQTLFAVSLSYTEIENIENKNLYEGVSWKNISSNSTNENGVVKKENIHVVKTSTDHVKLVNWSPLNQAGKLYASNTLNIAKDFELKNPGYKVLAGINGDYFTSGTTINSNMTYGGNILKYDDHQKYTSVYFDETGNFHNNTKAISLTDEHYLTVYNEDESIFDIVPIKGFNSSVNENETSVFYKTSNKNPTNSKNYKINHLTANVASGSTFHLRGKINTEVSSFSGVLEGELIIATRNERLSDKLKENPTIRVQRMHKNERLFFNNMIGVGSKLVENGHVRSFEAIGDQSLEFAKARHPRTSFGFTKEGEVVLLTVDGRNPMVSEGTDLRELGNIMKYYGCDYAYNLDGGGSTTMVIRENDDLKIVNRVSDSNPRGVYNALLIVVPDISVHFELSNYKKEEVDLNYEINNINHYEILEQKIVYNSKEKIMENLIGKTTLTSLKSNDFNTFDLVVKYKKDEKVYSQSFSSKVINLHKKYGLYKPEEPKNFQIEFVEDIEKKGFIAEVKFDDLSNEVKNITLYDENNLGYKVHFESGKWISHVSNLTSNREYTFNISYLKHDDLVSTRLPQTFRYKYVMPPVVPDTTTKPNPNSSCKAAQANVNSIIITILAVTILSMLTVILIKRT